MKIKHLLSVVVVLAVYNQAAAIDLSGEVESSNFYFSGKTFRSLKSECVDWYTDYNITSSVDDIYVSVNNSSTKKHLRNGPSYWSSANDVCDQIIDYARTVAEEDISDPGSGRAIRAKGRMENIRFRFKAPRLRGIKRKCLEFHRVKGITSNVDDIYISVNGSSEEHLYNNSGYWSSGKEVCDRIVQHIKNIGNDNGPSCNNHALGETWFEIDEDNPIVERKSCKRGSTGRIVISKERLVELKCTRSGVTPTGDERTGEVISRDRQCHSTTKPCGSHPHGSQWGERNTGPVKKEIFCGFANRGKQINIYRKTSFKSCNNGQTNTGEKLELKKAGQCVIKCAANVGTNGGVGQNVDRESNPLFVRLPGNTQVGDTVTTKCSKLSRRPVSDHPVTFRCNAKGAWEAGWDNAPRGRDDTRPKACKQREGK